MPAMPLTQNVKTIRQINTSEDRIDRLIRLCESTVTMNLMLLRHHIEMMEPEEGEEEETEYFHEVDKNMFALLYPQLHALPASDSHSFSSLPEWVQKEVVDAFIESFNKMKGEVRGNIDKLRGLASRLSEKFDIDISAYQASRYNVMVLVDRPTRGIMLFGSDPDWEELKDPTGILEIEVD